MDCKIVWYRLNSWHWRKCIFVCVLGSGTRFACCLNQEITPHTFKYTWKLCGKTTGLPSFHFHLKFNFSLLVVKFFKSKITGSNYVTEEEKEKWGRVSRVYMTDKDKNSDSEGDNKRKIKYLKLWIWLTKCGFRRTDWA